MVDLIDIAQTICLEIKYYSKHTNNKIKKSDGYVVCNLNFIIVIIYCNITICKY
jgi:hypothetical protein